MTHALEPCPFCKVVPDRADPIPYDNGSLVCRNCGATVHEGWNNRPIEDALRAQIAGLLEGLVEIRDLARTGLKPDMYATEELWNEHKVHEVAWLANCAILKFKIQEAVQ